MRTGFVTRKSIAPLLIAVSLAAAPGCKSGWKMPSPSSMWPWSRQPSAETLAGTPPKTTIESPAAKHSPSSVASVAAGTSKSASTAPAGSPTGYPSTSLASTPVKPAYGATAGTGAAASANGYQIGPYGMSGQSGTPTHTVSTPAAPHGQLPPNSYANTTGLPSSALPPAGTPNVSNPYGLPPNGVAQAGSTSVPSGGSQPFSMPNATPQMNSSMPQYQPNLPPPPSGVTNNTVGFPGSPYAPPSNAQLPPSSYPPSYGTPNYGTPGPASLPGTPGAAATGPSSPVPPAASADQYRPGSTGRTGNTYNFSTGSQTVPVNSGSYAPSQSTPPSTGSGYGNFQLPPNTANAGGQPTVR